MNKRPPLLILILVIALLALGWTIYINRPINHSGEQCVEWAKIGATNCARAAKPQVIRGHVTAISNECHSDGICWVTLDGSKVIVTGCSLGPNGTTCKPYDQTQLHSGEQVEATVLQTKPGRYSLDCDSCTIRIVGN